MTFEELWEKVSELKILPDTAIQQVPHVLSEGTKKKLVRMAPKEVVMILQEAIDAIDHGSVQTVDVLVLNKLDRRRTK